jgi:hypothetical protein
METKEGEFPQRFTQQEKFLKRLRLALSSPDSKEETAQRNL